MHDLASRCVFQTPTSWSLGRARRVQQCSRGIPRSQAPGCWNLFAHSVRTDLEQKGTFFSPKYIGRGCWVWAVCPLFSDRSVTDPSKLMHTAKPTSPTPLYCPSLCPSLLEGLSSDRLCAGCLVCAFLIYDLQLSFL